MREPLGGSVAPGPSSYGRWPGGPDDPLARLPSRSSRRWTLLLCPPLGLLAATAGGAASRAAARGDREEATRLVARARQLAGSGSLLGLVFWCVIGAWLALGGG